MGESCAVAEASVSCVFVSKSVNSVRSEFAGGKRCGCVAVSVRGCGELDARAVVCMFVRGGVCAGRNFQTAESCAALRTLKYCVREQIGSFQCTPVFAHYTRSGKRGRRKCLRHQGAAAAKNFRRSTQKALIRVDRRKFGRDRRVGDGPFTEARPGRPGCRERRFRWWRRVQWS